MNAWAERSSWLDLAEEYDTRPRKHTNVFTDASYEDLGSEFQETIDKPVQKPLESSFATSSRSSPRSKPSSSGDFGMNSMIALKKMSSSQG